MVTCTAAGRADAHRTVHQILVQQGEGAKGTVLSGAARASSTGEEEAEWSDAEAEGSLAGRQVHAGRSSGGIRPMRYLKAKAFRVMPMPMDVTSTTTWARQC